MNDLPVAAADTVNISMNIAVDLYVTSNDYDFDGYVDYDSVEIASSPDRKEFDFSDISVTSSSTYNIMSGITVAIILILVDHVGVPGLQDTL